MVVLSTPLLGRGGVVARTSWGPQPCRRNAGSSRSFDRKQDHVIAGASRHELETPKPNHCGARDRQSESGHLKRNGKSAKKTRRTPTWRANCRCFPRGGSHQRVNLYACSLFQMVMQEKTQRFILVRVREGPTSSEGGESLYYLAPKCLYRGEYKRDMDGV